MSGFVRWQRAGGTAPAAAILRPVDLQQLKIERKPHATTAQRRRRSPWPLRLAALAVLALLAWLFLPMLRSFSDRLRLPLVQTTVVRTSSPAAAAAVAGTAANGYVVAARRAALSSDVPGRIVELRVTEGSVVKQGDIVARLYSEEFRAALDRAIAERAVAAATVERVRQNQASVEADQRQSNAVAEAQQALVTEATAQHAVASTEHARTAELVAKAIASPRDLERTKADLDAAAARVTSTAAGHRAAAAAAASATARVDVARGDVAVAEAQLVAADAAVQQAQKALDKTDVRAPFDGVVVLKDAEVGEVVSPNVQGGGNARGAVCTMVDFASLEVQANVPETTLAAVQKNAAVDVFLDALPDQRLRGEVDRIWPTADRQKATVEVRIRLLDRPDALRPEMGVRVVFRRDSEPSSDAPAAAARTTAALLLVPENTLVEVGGKSGAFIVERDTVRFAEVRLGERKGGRAVVEQGLTAGQTLVVDPPTTLASGDRVRLADR